MKLILLYGPLAVGKLSVAEALASSTGFRVLHNHLFTDLAEAVFRARTPEMAKFTRHLREVSLDAARDARLPGVILTFVYPRDRDGYILGLCERAETAGDDVYLVHLTAALETLSTRVTEPSRRAFGKLTTVAGLREGLARFDEPFGQVAGRKSLSISTDRKTPAGVAAGIIQHLNVVQD